MARIKSCGLIGLLLVLGMCSSSFGWGHQGHILITRLAALRIIHDPNAPPGLREFLRRAEPYSMEDCRDLALYDTVGLNVQREQKYDQGLDHWCTWPDQLRYLPQGHDHIEPYGVGEDKMHYMDLEVFGPEPVYRDDLSNKPDVNRIAHDLNDPRWRRAGFVPWRVEEMYHRLADDFGAGPGIAQPDQALIDAGFLAHYVEDSTQPQHATVDYNSLSYLIGRIPQLPASANPETTGMAAIRLPHGINPHGDFEFQLFESASGPRAAFRQEYWSELLRDIDVIDADRAEPTVSSFNPFRWDLHILSSSYDALPFIGYATQAAYAQDYFDAPTYFRFRGRAFGREMDTVQLIALQNAKAVADVELVYRLAWHLGRRER